MAQDYSLRKVVRDAGGKYRVLKNKLAARASQGTQRRSGAPGAEGRFVGCLHLGRPGRAGQGALDLGEGQRRVHLQAGHRRRQGHHVEEVKQLATMPGKEELFAKLLFLIKSPAQRLATVINATGRDLAVVVNQARREEQVRWQQLRLRAEAKVEAVAAPAAEVRQRRSRKPLRQPSSSACVAAVEASAIAEGAAPDVTGRQPTGRPVARLRGRTALPRLRLAEVSLAAEELRRG